MQKQKHYYAQLKQITSSQENKLEAMRGFLRCQYQQQKWTEAVENAKELTAAKGSSADDKITCQYGDCQIIPGERPI